MNDTKEILEDMELLKHRDSVPIEEQETSILMMRDEKTASVYTSDTTMITKLDKLCTSFPDMWSVETTTSRSKTYLCQDKKLIRFGSHKREISEERKEAMGERMRQYHKNKATLEV